MKTRIFKTAFMAIVMMAMMTTQAFSQNTLQKARESMENYDFAEAASLYQKHFDYNTAEVGDARDLAQCYMKMNNTQAAEEWYGMVNTCSSKTAEDVYVYAGLLKTNGHYEEAIEQYRHLSAFNTELGDLSRSEIDECCRALEWMQNPTFFELKNVEGMNTENSDFGLIWFREGYLLASDRVSGLRTGPSYGWTGDPYIQLFRANGTENPAFYQEDAINTMYHNGPAVFDQGRDVLYFTRTRMVKVKMEPVNSDPTSWYNRYGNVEYVNRLELYSSQYNDGKWTEALAFPYNNAENYSVGHAALSPDGSLLYFVSDKPGGFGDADIYYSERLSPGIWSEPVNAGPSVNTAGKEVFPYIAPDGTLYFSSDGHPGMGGLDLFKATGERNAWTLPENLQYPMNSSRDDFSLILNPNGQSGYLSSNREGGKGSDDIYAFNWEPPSGLILLVSSFGRQEDGSVLPLGGTRVIETLDNGSVDAEMISDESGKAYATAHCDMGYVISVSKEGYFANNVKLETPVCVSRNDSLSVDVILDKIVIAKPIVLENIYYDFDMWNIRADAAVELDKLIQVLNDNPRISIELGSHTDARGTSAYNENLSQKRAESAVAYIVSRGIPAKRITAKGYGESVPVNSCVDDAECTEEQHQMNRRTEFKVTRLD